MNPDASSFAALATPPHWTAEQQERRRYVGFRTLFTFDRFIDLPRDGQYKILDYGCGDGHSIEPLLERFPNAHFVAVDCDDTVISVLRSRFADNPRITVLRTGEAPALEAIEHQFDIIQLNAVFEHLLPDERRRIVPQLWSRLAIGGYLVVTETPWRWFPVETHTTSFPLVNYLPDFLALMAVRHCGRFARTLTWREALKRGVRGATIGEILSCLGEARSAQIVNSAAPDAADLLEVWWHGECRQTRKKALAYKALCWLRAAGGLVVSPWVSLVLRKHA